MHYDILIPLGTHHTYAVRVPSLDERVGEGLLAVATYDGGDTRIAQCALPPAHLAAFVRAVDGGGDLCYFGRQEREGEIRAALVLVVPARTWLGARTREQPVGDGEEWRGTETVDVGEDEQVPVFLGFCTGAYEGELRPEVYVEHCAHIMTGGARNSIESAIDDFLRGQ